MNVKVSTAKRRRANSDTARSIKLAAGKTAGLRITKKLAKAAPKKRRRRTLKPVPRTYHPGPLIDGEATLAIGVAALLAQDPETIGHMLEVGGATPLRRREPGPIEISHGVLHILQQVMELGRAEFGHRLRHRQKAGVAHFENFAYCHGS